MYIVESLDNKLEVSNKFKRMELSDSVLDSLLRNSNIISIKNANDEVVYTVAIVISFSSLGTSGKVIGVWAKNGVEIKGIILALKDLAHTVWYSSKCVEAMGFEVKAAWQELVAKTEPFKSRILHDASTFAHQFIGLKNVCNSISDMVSVAELSKDMFTNNDLDIKYNMLSKYAFTEYANGVYSFPFLSKSMCKSLINKSNSYTYTTNKLEASAYQIPEAVLSEVDPEMYEKLLGLYYDNISSVSRALYFVEPDEVRSIQLAKYNTQTINKGNWHFDHDSDITVVVSLSDTHTGGGTVIKPYGSGKEIVIPQLPVGHALLFRGKHYLHKGLEVTKGERNILVFWSMAGDC